MPDPQQTQQNSNAQHQSAAAAAPRGADWGAIDAAPPPTAHGAHLRTAILNQICAHTRRAAPPQRWSFLKTTPWVRQLKGTAAALVAALQSEFAGDELVAAGVLLSGSDDELTLSRVFGDSTTQFVVLCDPPGTPVDAISARGALTGPHPPCLRYSPAHFTEVPCGSVQRLFAAVTDDEMHVLYRLGCQFTSAAGMDSVRGELLRVLFAVHKYNYVGQRPKFRLTVPGWQIASLRNAPGPEALTILEHLERIQRDSNYDPSILVDVWIPSPEEFRAIRKSLSSHNRGIVSRRFNASLKYSRCTAVEAMQFVRDRAPVDYGTARRRLVGAIVHSRDVPHAAEADAALNQLRRAFRSSVLDKFDRPDAGDDGWETLRQMMGSQLAEQWFNNQAIVNAALSVMAGEFPREYFTTDERRLSEQLRLVDRFAKLYALGETACNRRLLTELTRLNAMKPAELSIG